MKFCKDCQNYNEFWGMCIREKHQTGNNPVTGEALYNYKYQRDPYKERESLWPWRCGRSGRYFKRRITLRQIVEEIK